MAKWTVALFGHHKPKVDGWGKRAQIGDIIAYKLYEDAWRWTPNERKEFLIVTVDGPTLEQMEAMCEQKYDLDSYVPYAPMSYAEWENLMTQKAIKNYNVKWATFDIEKRTEFYNEYVAGCKVWSAYPKKHTNKRRFFIRASELKQKGVDLKSMLDRGLFYDPQPEFQHTEIWDKLRTRKVLQTDGLNPIQPLVF